MIEFSRFPLESNVNPYVTCDFHNNIYELFLIFIAFRVLHQGKELLIQSYKTY